MKIRDKVFAVGSAVVIAGLVLLAHSQEASAAPRTPTQKTCAAFRAWDHHRTPARLDRMVRLSRHASAVVRIDVEVVATEVKQNDWFDLPADVHFLALDCRR